MSLDINNIVPTLKQYLMKKITVLLIFSVILFGCNSTSKLKRSASSNPVLQSMDANAAQFLKDKRINSVSIGIYKDGKTYTRHYGELDRGKGNTPTDETLYEIASVTKTLTGMLVAQAVLDEKLDLEADIRTYLKADYPNLDFKDKPVKIKHLLTHTSGLPTNIPGIAELYAQDSEEAFFSAAKLDATYFKTNFFEDLNKMTVATEPGSKIEYNNIAPDIIAHILENVYGTTYDQLLEKYIFAKAGMTNTKINLNSEEQQRLANGYSAEGSLMPTFNGHLWGAAGRLKSTSADLTKYMKFLLESKDAVIAESRRKINQESEDWWRGYYWSIGDIGEATEFRHNGTAYGTKNWMMFYPEYNLGISVITNVSFWEAGSAVFNTVQALVDDLKPFGKKSIGRAISQKATANIEEAILYYHQLKKEQPEQFNFSDENELNALGYQLMGQDKLQEAIKVFKLLVAEFPDRSNPYDSLGEAYFNVKEFELSLKNYQKSLDLDKENTNAEEMIEKIKKL